ncbi:MAG: hypothetical protein INR73_16225 [Williamsia sp.]|nr:hypothetical protein [Williamsia sp.]
MKQLVLLFLAAAVACNSEAGYEKAEDAQDAGREFIRASLDGNYKKASFYLLKDSTGTNLRLLDRWKEGYNHYTEEQKVSFKDAVIRPVRITNLNDSSVVYTYTNSFEPKDTTSIKIVRWQGDWLVDLKDIH